MPKRQAQVLDLKVLLHQEYGITYTDMVIQYRGVSVVDFEVLSALPDWSVTPTLELLVLPGSHAQALELAKRAAIRDLGWAQLLAHVTHSGHHEDWLGHQAGAEQALRRANGLLPLEAGETGQLAERLRAEHRLDTLLSEFGAAAASIVRVVGQYPCPLQPTESVELSERYGAGLKFVANGIVLRRLTSGLAIAQSVDVCEAMRQAPKVAAANQRAYGACRGRVARLCVPLSVVVEFLGVRWEATAVVPVGELAYGTYTGSTAEPVRQLPHAAEVIEALSTAFDIPARQAEDETTTSQNVAMDDMNAATRRGMTPRDEQEEDSGRPLPLPASTRIFLGDDTPGVAGEDAEGLWDFYLLAAPELLPPLPARRRDRSGPITAWKTEVDTAVVAQDVGTTRPEFLFGPRASISPANLVAPVFFDPRTASGWTPPMPLRRCAKMRATITTFDFWTRRETTDGGSSSSGPRPTVAMSEEGLAKTMSDAVRDSSTEPAELRDRMFQRVSYLHDGAYCRLPCSCDGLTVETAARLHTHAAVQLLATHLERADPPLIASGGQLAAAVHEYGVAIRQLGRVAERVKLRHVKETLLCEMVARGMREVCHNRLRRTEYNDVPFAKKIVMQTLNDLFSKASPLTDTASERRRELVRIMTKKFDVDVASNISENIHSALLLQRLSELIGLVLRDRPETYDLHKLDPFMVDDIADLMPRVPTAGVGMRLAVRREPAPTAAAAVTEEGNKKKIDPLKTLSVAVAGGRVSWWMGKAMMRFAARLDALGQRSVWYLPGGPGRDWASERYREAAALGISVARGDTQLTKNQKRAGQKDKVVTVSSLSCQLVRACATNGFERHCSEHGAPERSRWDHAAGTDLDAPLATQSAEQWRWLFSIAATAVGYGAPTAAARFAPDASATVSFDDTTGTAAGGPAATSDLEAGGVPGDEMSRSVTRQRIEYRGEMWGTAMRAEALDPEPEQMLTAAGSMVTASALRAGIGVGTLMADETARRISDSGLASRGLERRDDTGRLLPPEEMQVLAGLTVDQQQQLNMMTVRSVDDASSGGSSDGGSSRRSSATGSERPASVASHLSEAPSDSGSDATHLSEASSTAPEASNAFLSPQAKQAIEGTLTLGRRSTATLEPIAEDGAGSDDDGGESGLLDDGTAAAERNAADTDDDEGDNDDDGDDEEPRLLGAGGGGYDMLALLMDAELALASLEGPPAWEVSERQRMQFAARRAVRSEVAARARLATLGLHHPQAAAALLRLGLQLEEDLGELETASRAIRRAYVGFRAALGRLDARTCEALAALRRVENRLLTGLEHVHDDDLPLIIEAVEAPPEPPPDHQEGVLAAEAVEGGSTMVQADTSTAELFGGTNLAEKLPTVEEEDGATGGIGSLLSPLKSTDTLGYGGRAVGMDRGVSTNVRRKMLRIAVRSKHERALRNVVSSDMSGLPS